MRHADRLAFAEGYHAGLTGLNFEQPYDQHDLSTQFGYGYQAGRAKLLCDLEDQLLRLEETV
jgi:ribosome modulation factor